MCYYTLYVYIICYDLLYYTDTVLYYIIYISYYIYNIRIYMSCVQMV